MEGSCKEVIARRKSVRSFSDKQVSRKDLLEILDAARLAPSAKNRQPWKFAILSDEQKAQVVSMFEHKMKINNTEETGMATIRIVQQASKLVIVFMDYEDMQKMGSSLTTNYLSVGASIENALLRATELGVSSLWVYDLVAIKSELETMLSPKQMFVSAICFGYEDKPLPRARKKSLDEILIETK